MGLLPCGDLSAASWIVDSDQPWQQLVRVGPSGLPAYARLRFIPDPTHRGQRETEAVYGPGAMSETEQLRTALVTLARYTRTPERCYFCLWDGWGFVPKAGAGSIPGGPTVGVPNRTYHLFEGALSDFGNWGAARQPGHIPDPAFVWPADRAWCIANDVDSHWAGIGAEHAAIHELIDEPRLDVVPTDLAQWVPHYR